jgi:hypothetical protein
MMLQFDSSHSTWLFDPDRMRFCRIPKGIDPQSLPLEREWQPYYALDLDDSGSFTVALSEDRTRLLRAWREPVDELDPTAELTLLPERSE